MRKVLASLKPYYYYLVGEGIKTIEVRKNMPKASDWDNEVLFYMSKDVKSFAKIPKEFQEKYRKHFGKVGMQFVCDNIEKYDYDCCPHPELGYNIGDDCGDNWYNIDDEELQKTGLTNEDFKKYGKGKDIYGWHISELKIYDKPKDLNDFCKPCPMEDKYNCLRCGYYSDYSGVCINYVNRPPQSWFYVEKNKEE